MVTLLVEPLTHPTMVAVGQSEYQALQVVAVAAALATEGPDAQQPKKGRKKKKKDPEAGRAKKAAKRERRQQERLENQSVERMTAPTAAPPRRRPPPLAYFLPSTARRELQQQHDISPLLRRGAGRGGRNRHGPREELCSGALQATRRLQCPLVWHLQPMAELSRGQLYRVLDSTPHRGTPWHTAVQMIEVACAFAAMRDMEWKGRELLEDVYALLQARHGDRDGVLLRKYRAGLKHVLDATWLLIREDADARERRPLPDGTPAADVVLFEELDEKQQACVYAIKAVMARGDGADDADKAIELDGSEGNWRYVKWLSLRAGRARKRRLVPCKESTAQEDALLLRAYKTRKIPQTVLALARSYADGPNKDAARCSQLISEAAELYPLSPYVHFHSGHLYNLLGRGKRDSRRVALCFKTAIHLAQGTWLRASLDYGTYCMEHGMTAEAMYHLHQLYPGYASDSEEDDDDY